MASITNGTSTCSKDILSLKILCLINTYIKKNNYSIDINPQKYLNKKKVKKKIKRKCQKKEYGHKIKTWMDQLCVEGSTSILCQKIVDSSLKSSLVKDLLDIYDISSETNLLSYPRSYTHTYIRYMTLVLSIPCPFCSFKL